MPGPVPPASSLNAAVSEMLNQTRDVLDGIPAEAVMFDCLRATAQGPAAGVRARHLADHILAQWVAGIECDLAQFPPPTLGVLQSIRQRMVEARDALLRVQCLLHDLSIAAASQDVHDRAQAALR